MILITQNSLWAEDEITDLGVLDKRIKTKEKRKKKKI